jgi:glycosyltransferase involved in cell wall biosynthesis
MRILFLSAWCPYPADNGSKQRIYHLLRGLAQRHEVDLVSFCPEGDDGSRAAQLCGFCREVTLLHEAPFAGRRVGLLLGLFGPQPRSMLANHSRAMARLVAQRAAAHPYDVVLASQLHMAPYALALQGAPLVVEELELARIYEQVHRGVDGARRMRHRLTWWKTGRYVRAALRRCAGFSVASEQELALVAALAPQGLPSAVVPNGVDAVGCAAAVQNPAPDTLIYPGAISYDANFDAVAHFLTAILPRIRRERPGTRLRVTGHATPEQIRALPAAEGVEFTGYLDDVRPAVAGAWAEVVPLRNGGGTRLKVLEALAIGTPVISTSKGVEGLELQPERDLLVADSPEQFAAQTVRLLGSPALRADLAARGRAAIARYDWAHSVQALEGLLERAVGGI